MKKAYLWIGIILLLTSCKTSQYTQHLAQVKTTSISLDSTITPNKEIEALIKPYREKLQQEMNISIGHLSDNIKKGKPNSSMGNWFADILEEAGRFLFEGQPIDFAMQNYGGLRLKSIQKGDIKVGDIYSLMPFDNTLVLMSMDKPTFLQLMNRTARDGGWPISKSVSYTLQDNAATNIYIKEASIENRDSFHVLLPDYIANGGDDCFFLKTNPRKDSHLFIRDIVIEHLTKLKEQGREAPVDLTKRILFKK